VSSVLSGLSDSVLPRVVLVRLVERVTALKRVAIAADLLGDVLVRVHRLVVLSGSEALGLQVAEDPHVLAPELLDVELLDELLPRPEVVDLTAGPRF
jgi:hypothetical protein